MRSLAYGLVAIGTGWALGKVSTPSRKHLDRSACEEHDGVMATMKTETQAPTLTAHDRCDRCGAQALVQVMLSPESSLLFCGHHYHANAAALDDFPVAVDNRPVNA